MLSSLLSFLGSLILAVADVYSWVIFFYVLMSWIPHDRGLLGDIYRAFGKICDPYLDLFKRLMPPIGGMVDITPIFALLVLQLGARLIAALL